MTPDITQQKKAIRTIQLQQRKAFGGAAKRQYDKWICAELKSRIQARTCHTIHAYIPIANEIDIAPLLRQLLEEKITVVCPKTLPHRQLENRILHSFQDLEVGPMKTLHPATQDVYVGTYDLIIVPGLAFDEQRYRLGYGGGYYDTFLATQPQAYKVGIYYPFQRMESVPTAAHDVQLDEVLWKAL